jgi:hypothetical protein
VDFSALVTVAGYIAPYNLPSLTSMEFPAIVTIGEYIALIDSTGALTTFTLGSGLKSVGGNVTMTNPPLNQASVNGLLVRLAALDGTGGTTSYDSYIVDLSGNCAIPSATGLAAKTTLEGRGNTVTVNASYAITAVDQTGGAGLNSFTVTDAAAHLNNSALPFRVVGSTGNDATYTVVSATSGAGSTVIVTVEVIPDATADGAVISG